MEFPGRLVSQIAAEAGITPHRAKLALYISAQARSGATLVKCCQTMNLSTDYVTRIAREFVIDFVDYRPFAKLDERPEPIGKLY